MNRSRAWLDSQIKRHREQVAIRAKKTRLKKWKRARRSMEKTILQMGGVIHWTQPIELIAEKRERRLKRQAKKTSAKNAQLKLLQRAAFPRSGPFEVGAGFIRSSDEK